MVFVSIVKMGIDINQWRSVIGNFGIKGKSHNEKSRQRWEFMEEMAAKEMIQQEVKGFWKNVIVSLLFACWFFMVHSLNGEGRLGGLDRRFRVLKDWS